MSGIGKLLLIVVAGGLVNKLLIRSFWKVSGTATTTNAPGLLAR